MRQLGIADWGLRIGRAEERGVALVTAVVTLVVIGAMVAGSLFIALQEQRAGRNTVRQQQAFTTAESAALEPVTVLGAAGYRGLAVGAIAAATGTTTTGRYRRSMRRLGPVLYLSQADGFSWDGAARQRVAVLLRLSSIPLTIEAALQSGDPPGHEAWSAVSGEDAAPEGWTGCPATGTPIPAVQVRDSLGSADIPFESLRRFATKTVPPGDVPVTVRPRQAGGACDVADVYNWGDPADPKGPCGGHFPAIWVESDLRLDGLRGQGVLMVNGDLTLEGAFAFAGLVLVRGTLTADPGTRLTGAVMAGAVSLDPSGTVQGPIIEYSSCAVSRALAASAVLLPLRERAWAELY